MAQKLQFCTLNTMEIFPNFDLFCPSVQPILTIYFLLVRNPAIKIIGKRNEREFAKGSADASAEKPRAPLPNHSNQDSPRVQPLELQNPRSTGLTAPSSSRTQDEASSRLEALLNTTLPVSVRPKCKNSENVSNQKSFEWNLKSTPQSKLPR